MKYFLDTNICIYFLKSAFPSIRERMKECRPADIKIASMVKAELLHGAEKSSNPKRNRQKLETFLSNFKIIPFGAEESVAYAKLRTQLEKEGSPIGGNDMIIAATVIANSGTLVTNNEKEFRKVKGLKIENWTI